MTIRDAVWNDIDETRAVYVWVKALCLSLGASEATMVDFEHYAEAAKSLTRPSSVARALQNGATAVERIDLLIQLLARSKHEHSLVLDTIITKIAMHLERNRTLCLRASLLANP